MTGIESLAGISFPLGLGLGGDQVAFITPSSPSSNPNLLLSPDAFDNAIWLKVATVVTPDAGDPTYPAADQLAMSGSGSGSVAQVSATAAITGAAVSTSWSMTSTWQIVSRTGTFNGLPYTLTVEVRQPSAAGDDISIQLSRSGGFLTAMIFDGSGFDPTFLVRFMKLEQSASFSGYP